ncbi:MAG: heat shock protein HtpX [Gaiellales bacterium]|nr:heat shock protein HtpX [Gaiellales bacterium]MDX6598482.1 heat shock protein HtpX [Gaiellales bacterium]
MSLQEQIRANRRRSAFVVFGFALLIGVFTAAIWFAFSPSIGILLAIIGIGYGIFSYLGAGRLVASVAHARPVTKEEQPKLVRAVENMAIAAGLDRTPPVYVIEDDAPNAFAAGRKPEDAYVAATTGLVALMDQRELEGVMAHEISHIRNRDVRLMTLAAVLVGVIALMADLLFRISLFGGGRRDNREGGNPITLVIGIAALVLAPISAALLQASLSRRREYLADSSAAEITGDPEGLARALAKLGNDKRPLKYVTRATAHLYIESPLRDNVGLRSSLGGLFDTHPPLEDRIHRLEEAGGFDIPDPEPLDQ